MRPPRGARVLGLVAVLVLTVPLSAASIYHEVEVRNDRFDRESVFLVLGDTLRIHNLDGFTRRFVTEPEAWSSGAIGPGGTAEWHPEAAGDYLVRDALQPELLLQVHVEPYTTGAGAGTARIQIEAPGPGSIVSGIVQVRGTASNPAGELTGIQHRLDGSAWVNLTPNATWRFELDTTRFEDGGHLLEVRARDDTTWSAPERIRLQFENGENEPPVLTVAEPLANSTLEPRLLLARGNVTDPEGDPVTAELRLNHRGPWEPARVHANGTWDAALDLRDAPTGRHHLEVRAHAANQTTTASLILYVERPPASLPTIRVLQWERGATVQGTITLRIQAEGGAGIPYSHAEWRLPGGPWQPMAPIEGTGNLFEATWNTTRHPAGTLQPAFRVHDGTQWSHPHLHPFIVHPPDGPQTYTSKYPAADAPSSGQDPIQLPESESSIPVPGALGFLVLTAIMALATRSRRRQG